jgi:hypothetical protein
MNHQLSMLQQKDIDNNYLKEEIIKRDHTVRMLEDTIRTLNKDVEDLKTHIK